MKRINYFLSFTLVTSFYGCFSSELLTPEPTLSDLDNTPPVCPGLISAEATAGPTITLAWHEAEDNFTKASDMTYRIYMHDGSTTYDLASPTKTVIGSTFTSIQGVRVGRTYSLFVQCLDANGNKAPNGPTNVFTVTILDVDAPSTPTLSIDTPALPDGYTKLRLTWTASYDGEAGTGPLQMKYNIYSSSSPGVNTSGSPLATITGGQTYLHENLNPNTRRYYKVVAEDSVGLTSTDSNEVTGETFDDVVSPIFSSGSQIEMADHSETTIELSWSAASDNVTGAELLQYQIYRCQGSTTCDPVNDGVLIQTVTGVTGYTDDNNSNGLTPSTVYVYAVRARDSRGNLSIYNGSDKVTASTLFDSSGIRFVYSPLTEANYRFGSAVAVGNVYGPTTGPLAFDDLVVGVPNDSITGSTTFYTGCVYIYEGLGNGNFSKDPVQRICEPNAPADGNYGGGNNYGSAIALADMDGDGDLDLVVANPFRDRIYVHLRGATTLSSQAAGTISRAAQNGLGFGICAGDITGDGVAELIVASAEENCAGGCGGRTRTGNLLVYRNDSSGGSFSPLQDVPDTIYSPTSTVIAAPYSWNITNGEGLVASCTIGNFDAANPSRQFVAVGAHEVDADNLNGNEGAVLFYEVTNPGAHELTFRQALLGPMGGISWGYSVAAVKKDGPGDNHSELFVGAITDSTGGVSSGAVYGYTVNVTGTGGATTFNLVEQGVRYFGGGPNEGSDTNNNGFGSGIAFGDLNGNGYPDMVVGAYLDDNTTNTTATNIDIGRVYTYLNNGSGTISSTIRQYDFTFKAYSVQAHVGFGSCLAKGDFNNDGIGPDIAVGAYLQDYAETAGVRADNQGAILIYNAVQNGEIDFENPSQIIFAPGNQANSYFGMSCLGMDFDNDGNDDLVVGSPYRAFTGAGNQGAVFVYLGAENTALSPTISTTLTAPSTGASQFFGWGLGTGDFDGNGVPDLAITALNLPGVTTNRGHVYVHWGKPGVGVQAVNPVPTRIDHPTGAGGTGTNPYLNASNTINTVNNQYFGSSLESFPTSRSTAGEDLIVCAVNQSTNTLYFSASHPARTSIGNCYIYRGSINLNGSQVNYSIDTFPWNEIRYPSSKTGASKNSIGFGASMTKGDWNGDGILDLVVCAERQDKVTSPQKVDAGACFAYLGHSSGMGFSNNGTTYLRNGLGNVNSVIPDEAYYNTLSDTSVDYFGRSVLLGDVNNNSDPDLIVGVPLSYNQTDQSGGSSVPTNFGKFTGRVHLIRGGYQE
jgi:hypothetical protein